MHVPLLRRKTMLTVLDLCTGGGGEALGLEAAGFSNVGSIDNDAAACQTLRLNRPAWRVIEDDLQRVSGAPFRGVDLVAGGVPCPPFSIAGKQLGADDERNLFPAALRVICEARPVAVLLENVPGLASAKFADYRNELLRELARLGYDAVWRLLNASDYGVPQLRPRFVLVALRPPFAARFQWPEPLGQPPTVGQAIGDLMAAAGWPGATSWQQNAGDIAPTLVGGSKKHGGPDLGPTRAKKQWETLGVNGWGIADLPPGPDFPLHDRPKLTLRMTARLQAFPDAWAFAGGKTAAYRQIGNALPPPVAQAVGMSIRAALDGHSQPRRLAVPVHVQPLLLEEPAMLHADGESVGKK
jgi:DNA (cytosine-5)-methyltransferase 1